MLFRISVVILIAAQLGWIRDSIASRTRPEVPRHRHVGLPKQRLSTLIEPEKSSFLAAVDPNLPVGTVDLQSQILDPHRARELGQEFESANANYDLRRNHGLVDPFEEQAYQRSVSDFSKKVVDELRKFHAAEGREKARKAMEPDVKKLPSGVLVVAGLAYNLYSGERMEWAFNPQLKVSGWTNVQDRTANFGVNTAIVDATMDFVADAPETRNPSVPIDPKLSERYRVNLSRSIPFLDLTSGISYGSSTGTVSASIRRPLMDNLVGVYETSHPLNYPAFAEDKIRVEYGLHF